MSATSLPKRSSSFSAEFEQQAGDARLGIAAQQCQRDRHPERELEGALAARAVALAIGFLRKIERRLHPRAVVRPEALDQLGGGVAERGNRDHAAP
jgi:hypothetical protein